MKFKQLPKKERDELYFDYISSANYGRTLAELTSKLNISRTFAVKELSRLITLGFVKIVYKGGMRIYKAREV